MFDVWKSWLFYFVFLSVVVFTTLHAQIGEIAGFVYINTSVGGSSVGYFTIVNPTNQSFYFQTIAPTLSGGAANQSIPTTILTPANGTLKGHSSLNIYINASVPSNDMVGLVWTGYAEALVAPNVTNGGGGAQLQVGVAKKIIITSIASKTNWLLIYAVVGVVALIVIAVAAKILIDKKVIKLHQSKGTKSASQRASAKAARSAKSVKMAKGKAKKSKKIAAKKRKDTSKKTVRRRRQ